LREITKPPQKTFVYICAMVNANDVEDVWDDEEPEEEVNELDDAMLERVRKILGV